MDSSNHIAVIGMAGRFPQAPNLEIFWENICKGFNSVQRFSRQEMLADGVSPEAVADEKYRSARAILEDAEGFDASFFGISPSEAELLDPQHRNFLEICWLALEDGNVRLDRCEGRTGVFASTGVNAYALHHLTQHANLSTEHSSLQALMSSDKDYLATRVSYKLNLHGPSLSIQTACSSSLVAVHAACQSLLSGECDLALAGGVTIRFPQKSGFFFAEGGIYSPEGNCRPFDARANGTADGSGAGVVLLKRLDDALTDNDAIHAIILATAVNNDGSRKVGFTAPSISGQAQVIAEAQELANIPAESIGYLEAHGTGTQLGDPIEVRALTQVFREQTASKNFCALSSVKANIGHLDTAAGIAGFIKACLVVKNGKLPPAAYFENPNPELHLEESPFFISTQQTPWPESEYPRRAGVSSFGVGGTNAHVIIQQAPSRKPSPPEADPQLFFCSAKTQTACATLASLWNETLQKLEPGPFADAAFTSREGRQPLQHRSYWVGSAEDLPADAWHQGTVPKEKSPLVFVFPGQGFAFDGILGPLVQWHPALRARTKELCALAQPLLQMDLFPIITESSSHASALLRSTEYSQPALFICEVALGELLMEAGLKPWALIGHSLGEYVAATLSGVFKVKDALGLVIQRGQLMARQPAGAMTAVSLSPENLGPYLEAFHLELAVINGPERCVVSGSTQAVEALEGQLGKDSIVFSRLPTSHAFHSKLMEGCLQPFRHAVASITTQSPEIPFVSNLTGKWIETHSCSSAGYWSNHLRKTVQFEKGLRTLCETESPIFLTVGPDMGLASLLRSLSKETPFPSIALFPKQAHAPSRIHPFLHALGKLWLLGFEYHPGFLERGRPRNFQKAPQYPFEHKTFTLKKAQPHPMAVAREESKTWFYTPGLKRLPPLSPPHLATEKRHVLLFCNPGKVATALENFLAGNAISFQRVQNIPATDSQERRFISVNPQLPNWAESLKNQLSQPPTHLLYAWSDGPSPQNHSLDRTHFQTHLLNPCHILKFFGHGPELQAFVALTAGGLGLFPQKVANPLATGLLGLLNTAAVEFPNVSFKVIDFDPATCSVFSQRDAQLFWWESLAPSHQRAIIYRASQRYGLALDPLDFSGTPESCDFSKEDTILITGGLGDLGMALAESLAQKGVGNLILLTRQHFSDKDLEPQTIERLGERNLKARKLRQLASLESLGTRIQIHTCDVTNTSDLLSLKTTLETRSGKVTGIIHAAGLAKGAAIAVLTEEEMAETLAVKYQAAETLDQVFEEHPIPWFIGFSSLSSLTGAKNLAAYTAANAALDGFAHKRLAQKGAYTASINWGPWSEAGMALQADPCAWLLFLDPATTESHSDPLLDQVLYEHPRYSVYQTTFSPDHHWFLREHRFESHAVMPGAFYLEWCRRIYGTLGEGTCFLLDHLYFLSPLVFENATAWTLRAIAFWVSESQWDIHIFGKPVAEEGTPAWKKLVIASANSRAEASAKDVDLPDVRAWDSLVENGQSRIVGAGLELGAHWDVLQNAWKQGNQILAHLQLPEEFHQEIGSMPLHTSLIDIATGLASKFCNRPQALLPFSYRDLVLYQPLPAHCTCLLECLETGAQSQPFVKVRMTLFDTSNQPVLTLGEFTMREIQFAKPSNTDAAKTETPKRKGIPTLLGVQAFHTLLANRLGPQVVISPQDPRTFSQPTPVKHEPDTPHHSRPALEVPYVAPSTNHEQILTQIWSSILGIESLGVLDNFFELGGDSVMGLQMMSRLKDAGYQISPQAIFDHPTVQSLAQAMAPPESIPFRPLPSWQARILQNAGAWDDYHQVCCVFPDRLDFKETERAIHALKNHLPYLASTLSQENGLGLGIEKSRQGHGSSRSDAMKAPPESDAPSLSPIENSFPLFKWAAFPEDETVEKLVFYIHPLLTDGNGLGEFMRTVEMVWADVIADFPDLFPTQAASPKGESHRPSTSPGQAFGAGPVLRIKQEILSTVDSNLLARAHQPFLTRTIELILFALQAHGFKERIPFSKVIHVESRPQNSESARGNFEWGSELVALFLDADPSEWEKALPTIKEHLRNLQKQGEDTLPEADLIVSDWGDLTPSNENLATASLQWESVTFAPRRAPTGRPYPIQLQIWQWNGVLRFTWFYNPERYTEDQISFLSCGIQARLQELLAQLCQTDTGAFTPSDFPHSDLDDRELASLLEEFGDVGGYP